MDPTETQTSEPTVHKKSRLGLVLAIVAVTVLVAGAAVAGTLFGPTLFNRSKAEPVEQPVGETVELPPILVDAHARGDVLHHLKVVLAIELTQDTAKDEFMRYVPRGREAAVAFLRSRSFEDLSAPSRFHDIRVELAKEFSEAVGKKRVARVMITDYVAQ